MGIFREIEGKEGMKDEGMQREGRVHGMTGKRGRKGKGGGLQREEGLAKEGRGIQLKE